MKKSIFIVGLCLFFIIGSFSSVSAKETLSFLKEGKKRNVYYIQHFSGDSYELGLLSKKGKLTWQGTNEKELLPPPNESLVVSERYELEFNVYVDEDIAQSYVKRLKNKKFKNKNDQTIITYRYELHIAPQMPLQSGSIVKKCHRNIQNKYGPCEETIHSTMIQEKNPQ